MLHDMSAASQMMEDPASVYPPGIILMIMAYFQENPEALLLTADVSVVTAVSP